MGRLTTKLFIASKELTEITLTLRFAKDCVGTRKKPKQTVFSKLLQSKYLSPFKNIAKTFDPNTDSWLYFIL